MGNSVPVKLCPDAEVRGLSGSGLRIIGARINEVLWYFDVVMLACEREQYHPSNVVDVVVYNVV